jgi:hypothetical protein
MTVYIVTVETGFYTAYDIVDVCATKEEAEKVIEKRLDKDGFYPKRKDFDIQAWVVQVA